MSTRSEFEQHVGQWIRFRTKYGNHVGLVERVTNDSAIMISPRNQIPVNFAGDEVSNNELERLDLALAWWGGGGLGRGGYPGGGYGRGVPGAGAYRGGGYGGYGWGRWAVSFLVIYALFGLWFW